MTVVAPTSRRWCLVCFQLAVVVVVLVAVGGTLRAGWAKLAIHDRQWQPAWLAAAGLSYLAGFAPMAWYWRRVLMALGQRPDWLTTLDAYFLGHLGKYVPGKALVLVIRVGLLRPTVTSIRLAVASVVLETLSMMAVGGALAAALSALTLQLDPKWTLVAITMAAVAGAPTLPPIARRLAGRVARNDEQPDEGRQQGVGSSQAERADDDAMRRGITLALVATGWLAAVVGWSLLGLSLWAALRGMGIESHGLVELPRMVAAASLAVVAGFLSLLPGGIVVRDVLLVELLAPVCGEADALVAAVLIRVIWLLSELGICGILRVVRVRHA